MVAFVLEHPLGGTQKRVWFLYEYLTGKRLDIPDGEGGSYLPLVDEELHFAELTDDEIARMEKIIGGGQGG